MINEISSPEALELISTMQNLNRTMNNYWINFYGLVYKFRFLKTELGYNDLKLNDNSIIKKSKLIKQLFNISESLYSRIVTVCERFMKFTEDSVKLLDEYKEFDRTKLIELLQLDSQQLQQAMHDNIINPSLSLKELRKVIKRLNGKTEEVVKPTLEELEQVPYTRTFREHFEYNDLKKFTKQELIDLYIELQRNYESMKVKKIAVPQNIFNRRLK